MNNWTIWQNRCVKGNIAFVLDWEKWKNGCRCTSSLWQVSKFSYHLCMSYEQIFDGYVDTMTCWCWWICWCYMLMLMDTLIIWHVDVDVDGLMDMLILRHADVNITKFFYLISHDHICVQGFSDLLFPSWSHRFYNYSSRKIVNCKIQIAQHFFFCQARMWKC